MKSPHSGLRTLWASPIVIGLLTPFVVAGVICLVPVVVLVVKYEMPLEIFTRPLAIGMLVLAAGYGFLRGLLFHPAFDTRYSKWLANTPWTPKHPLPKGPVHLVWTDAVVVGALTATAYVLALTITPPIWPFVVAPVVLFAVAITAVWTLANVAVGQGPYVYAVVWVPVLFSALGIPLIGFLFCPFVMAGIAWLGVRRSLAAFPWTDLEANHGKESKNSSSIVGWPYGVLLHPAGEFRTTVGRAFMEAALVAAWVWFALTDIEENQPKDGLAGLAMFVLLIGALLGAGARLIAYGPVICGNLCWGQRLANKQWIIRRHDQIFLAPLLMVVVAVGLPWILYYGLGASAAASFAPAAGMVVLIGRRMGPSVQELQYTGVHSKFGTLAQSKEFITARGSNS
jgi:hypothetical protein